MTRLTFTDQASTIRDDVQNGENVGDLSSDAHVGGQHQSRGGLCHRGDVDAEAARQLDLHLVNIYGHLQNPFGSWATGQSGPFHSINADPTECDHR